jgi:hypothetical protein
MLKYSFTFGFLISDRLIRKWCHCFFYGFFNFSQKNLLVFFYTGEMSFDLFMECFVYHLLIIRSFTSWMMDCSAAP